MISASTNIWNILNWLKERNLSVLNRNTYHRYKVHNMLSVLTWFLQNGHTYGSHTVPPKYVTASLSIKNNRKKTHKSQSCDKNHDTFLIFQHSSTLNFNIIFLEHFQSFWLTLSCSSMLAYLFTLCGTSVLGFWVC
jgi:hypothetical protein